MVQASEPAPCAQPGSSISPPAWTPSSSARLLAWTPPGSFPTPPTRFKTPGSPACEEVQAPPCTRWLERVRFARLVDGGLGAECPSFFEVLPVAGLLAGQVEAGAGRDDLGAEGPGGAALAALPDGPAEDDGHLVRAADVEGCRGSAAREKIRPLTGRSRAMVVENSICPPGSCQR